VTTTNKGSQLRECGFELIKLRARGTSVEMKRRRALELPTVQQQRWPIQRGRRWMERRIRIFQCSARIKNWQPTGCGCEKSPVAVPVTSVFYA
jgi:hypothetical protein